MEYKDFRNSSRTVLDNPSTQAVNYVSFQSDRCIKLSTYITESFISLLIIQVYRMLSSCAFNGYFKSCGCISKPKVTACCVSLNGISVQFKSQQHSWALVFTSTSLPVSFFGISTYQVHHWFLQKPITYNFRKHLRSHLILWVLSLWTGWQQVVFINGQFSPQK